MGFGFEDLQVYKKSLNFADKVYQLTKRFPDKEIYGITSQLRRAAMSISSNIAEGSARFHKKDFTQYLRIARGSLYECVPLLEISARQNYIDNETRKELMEKCNELAKMINGLIKSLDK